MVPGVAAACPASARAEVVGALPAKPALLQTDCPPPLQALRRELKARGGAIPPGLRKTWGMVPGVDAACPASARAGVDAEAGAVASTASG